MAVAVLSFDEVEIRYRRAIALDANVAPEALDRPQTLVLTEADRAGSGLAVAYHIGAPTLIRTDPDLAPQLQELNDPQVPLTSEAFQAWADQAGIGFFNGGDQHIMAAENLVDRPLPDGAGLRILDPDQAEVRAVVSELLTSSDPEDVDAAEFELDDLDRHMLGLFDGSGALGALVSGRPWGSEDEFDDIGILVRDDLRGHGWGASAVTELCRRSFELGRLPIYRCNWDRPASKATALAVGFQLVGRLTAVGSPED